MRDQLEELGDFGLKGESLFGFQCGHKTVLNLIFNYRNKSVASRVGLKEVVAAKRQNFKNS